MSSKKVFVREATGLVRELSTTDSFMVNVAFIAIPWGLATYVSAPYFFPGSDPVIATIICTFLSVFVGLTYSMLTWAMPRTCGDYVFMSRTLNPVLGFVGSFSYNMWVLATAGIVIGWIPTLVLSPVVLVVGSVTGNQSLVALASNLLQPQYVIAIGTIILIANVILLLGGSLRAVFRATTILVVLAIASIAIMLWLLSSNTHANFINSFNGFASYDSVIAAAKASGYSPQGPNAFNATLGVMPFVFASTGYGVMTSYFGGEIKKFKTNALFSQVLSIVFTGVILTIIGALAMRVFGYEFLGSISAISGTSAYPSNLSPPYFILFVSMLTNNVAVLWLLAITFGAATFVLVTASLLSTARSMFAWSFDRILPSKVADISDRFHTPTFATLLGSAIVWVSFVAYTYGPPYFLTMFGGALLAEVFTFILVAVAAIIFPFRSKAQYNQSAAKVSFAGIPLISIFGTVALGFYLVLAYFFISNPLYGANTPIFFEGEAIFILAPVLIYAISYYYHKREGLDISLAFKQLPPE